MKASSAYTLCFRLVGWLLCLTLLCQPGAVYRAARLGSIIPVTDKIQDAIDIAQDGDTISIPAALYIETLTVDKSLTLVSEPGVGGTMAVIWPSGNTRIITVQAGHDLILEDLVLAGGFSDGPGANEGGAVLIQNGTLTIDNCLVYSNKGYYGGAVRQIGSGGVIVQNGSKIYTNYATFDGGGILADGSLSMIDFTMEYNQAGRHGGGASVMGEQLSAEQGEVTGNTAGQNGGAFNVAKSVFLDQVDFVGNSAGTNGGAILQWNGNDDYAVDIQNTTFDDNRAGLTGGALSVYQGASTTIGESHFQNNAVYSTSTENPKGGAVYFSDTSWAHTLTITSTSFISNSSDCSVCGYPSGGGIYADTLDTGKILLDGDEFIRNHGWQGGGVAADMAMISGTTFQGNSGGDGPGAYLKGASQIKKSSFLQNGAVNSGGGLFVSISAESLSMEDTKFVGNSGGHDLGGAMSVHAETITMKNVAVADTLVSSGSAIDFANPASSIELFHVTVNDTHLQGGSHITTIGIHIKGPDIVNIWNSMITNQAIGVKIEANSACSLDHTLWYGNTENINGAAGSYADYYPVSADPAYAVDRYHLTSASGAIDQGVDRLVYKDIDGNTRDSQPDIGADEFRALVFLPLTVR